MKCVLISLLLIAVQLSQCLRNHGYEKELRQRKHYYFSDDQKCAQDVPDCEKCLSNSENCEWCSDGSQRRECIRQGSVTCPTEHRKTACESQTALDENKKTLMNYYDKSLDELAKINAPVMDTPSQNTSVVTVNASVLCGSQSDCHNCTRNYFCFWCQPKGECHVYYNMTTAQQSCHGLHAAYHERCFFPMGVTPCRQRNSTCEECLEDGICYWCYSTKTCRFYQEAEINSTACPNDIWYHEDCGVGNSLFWVLFPILAIILIPVIIYLIIWLICCCMRAAGYEPLQPAGSEPPKKHPKSIRLKPSTPSNKTDQLRKKYDLDNP